MTNEEKQLLLKDLCARLPSGVMYATEYGPRIINDLFIYSNGPVYTDHNIDDDNEEYGIELENIKPYLRPMSSMTQDEELECINQYYRDYVVKTTPIENNGWKTSCATLAFYHHIEWLNEHHFDYRGLIEKGLALEAPEGMYK